MNHLRILIADDHEVVRRGIRALLDCRSGWKVCGEAATGKEAVRKVAELKPDIVILDINMPELDGLEATREIREAHPQTEVLILTMHDSGHAAKRALDNGAHGVVLKSDLARDLVCAVGTVRRHEYFLTSRSTERILKASQELVRTERGEALLTPRENEVLKLLAEGKSYKEAAALLGLSPKTVHAHRTNIGKKLNLTSLSELIHFAIRNRIAKA